MSILKYHESNFKTFCDELAGRDEHLASVINTYGYPPMWVRPASFATLVLIILEQQVSLASAYAAFKKLKEKAGNITASRIMQLTDEELRSCYLSRQKMTYVRGLAQSVLAKQLRLKSLNTLDDESVRYQLKKHKGIGDWTADIYLIHALNRTDIFPIGDLALVKSLKELKQLPAHTDQRELLEVAELWRPYRTIATMLLWHRYIQQRKMTVLF